MAFQKDKNHIDPVSEVLVQEEGEVRLARVLLRYNVPAKRYPHFGVWSYLINTAAGIVVLDAGPQFLSILPAKRRPWKKSCNVDLLLEVKEKYFPGQRISEILLSHWHYDHSQAAPALQMEAGVRYGHIPPIRIHREELEGKRLLRFIPGSLEKVFKRAGYDFWLIGEPLLDGEWIEGSGFRIKHLPGHTSGQIGLISDQHKVWIAGWYVHGIKDPVVRTLVYRLIDEDKHLYPLTYDEVENHRDYKCFTYHPQLSYISAFNNQAARPA